MSESPVYWIDGDDPAMLEAAEQARANFRYFWREMTWEYRRVIPAVQVSAVKVPFTDTVQPGFFGRLFGREAEDVVEVMWVSDVQWDGRTIRGRLLNQPNQLVSVKQGDAVEVELERVVDWMYVIHDRVYGAWTVNLMRARMPPEERAQHDGMWGLDFGDPDEIELVPADYSEGGPDDEHPMSENIAGPWAEQLAGAAETLLGPDPDGWTQLHYMALGGALSPVKVLLEAGADLEVTTPDGRTARDLAEGMGWTAVVAALDTWRDRPVA